MTFKILFLGDICGKPGRTAVREALPSLIESYKPDFVIVNGENSAAGIGITPEIADELFKQGVQAITLGNHSFNKRDIFSYLDSGKPIVRPINMAAGVPGIGSVKVKAGDIELTVVNACGRVFLDGYDDPFRALDEVCRNNAGPIFVDFHAEATSEKVAMGWYLDGRVCAVVGTHTHIQTADERILPNGTAYITDVGMCGPETGVIGMDREIVLKKFLTGLPARFEVAIGPGVVCGVLIEVDKETNKAVDIQRIRWST